MNKWKSDLQIYNFYLFKLSEKFAEKQKNRVSKDDISQNVDIFW